MQVFSINGWLVVVVDDQEAIVYHPKPDGNGGHPIARNFPDKTHAWAWARQHNPPEFEAGAVERKPRKGGPAASGLLPVAATTKDGRL